MPPNAQTDFWHYFSILQYKTWKHAQGCPQVARQVVAPQTVEYQGPGEKKREAGVNKQASSKPVHRADRLTDPYPLWAQRFKHMEQAAKAIT